MIPPLKSFALAIRVMKTFARSERSWRTVGSFIVLQGEFWPNGIYAGISEVAYAMQDLSVNRVGIFPTKRIERSNRESEWRRGFGGDVSDGLRAVTKGLPARLPTIGSVKIIVVFHDGATIVASISISVSLPFFSGFSRISSCNKP
ncbi:hypothetical protein LGN17_26135 [Burkholderia sp. AU30280]|uniref:hypothetical protein n=1 Tax=unclassified Burkholderia TaxID=2613784 RepID=UPI001CF2D6CE|nr:hypothetical protein [Burkholderia sp. AU30280]MCA8275966.1 hypothetical protein [Burkholderia sp. AU30280]